MSEATVRNWQDVEPVELSEGIQSYELVVPEETPAERISANIFTLEPGSTFEPDTFQGEIFYCVLAGQGILRWVKDHTPLPNLIENDMGGWIPGTHEYQFENTGEGPMRLLSVACETDGSYGVRDGSVTKLDTVTPDARKIDDTYHEFGTPDGEKLAVAGYQTFSPKKAQDDHWHDEELIYAVRGDATLVNEGEEFELDAGSAAHNPQGSTHRLINGEEDRFGYIVLEFAE
jgi:quercetin dioxygenase-like cupin family protein